MRFFVPLTLVVILVDRGHIRFEEKMLARKFGQDYDKYCRRTRRWI